MANDKYKSVLRSAGRGSFADPPTRYTISLAEVQEAIADLVKMGLLADSGRRRNGAVVWMLTPQGKMLLDKMPDRLLETMLADGAGRGKN